MSTSLSDYDYELPEHFIAQAPAYPRDSSKLLVVNKKSENFKNHIFRDIENILTENDVLVINETHVIPARLKGLIQEKNTDCEIFLHKQLSKDTWDCLVYPGKKLKAGAIAEFYIGENKVLTGKVIEISEKGRIIKFSESGNKLYEIIETIGNTPLPPYIKNFDSDPDRYQTVYNNTSKSGSVAAPTAGLHFTPELLERLRNKGVRIEKVFLQVGLGTFGSVESEDITDHTMHSETISIEEEVARKINTYKSEGKRIIAVGTTSVRTLESFANTKGILEYGTKETSIFIYPGYQWQIVNGLITNFHLPKSTLLMLVSSMAGREKILRAYEHAKKHNYRFFSFGDAMLVI